jgi:hypothetical protein
MANQAYERLTMDDDTATAAVAGPIAPLVGRPAPYYGEGPFEATNSDSGDEDDESDSLLEKKLGPASPGLAERGEPFSSSGLRLGDDEKAKVRSVPR